MLPRTESQASWHSAILGSVPVRALFCGVIASALASPPLWAQDTIQIAADELACPACVITVDSVLTLGGLDGPGLDVIDPASRVAVDHKGRILVSVFRSAEVSVFDSTGAFLRTFGGSGEGPGEYALINHVNAGPRYIHVFDIRGRTLLDHDFEFVRQNQFPAQRRHSAVVDSQRIAITGVVPTQASAGHPLHILTRDGQIESFGGRGPVVGNPGWDGWQVTGDARSLWVVEHYENEPEVNRLIRWDLASPPRRWTVYNRAAEEFDASEDAYLAMTKLTPQGLWVIWGVRGGVRKLDLVDPATGMTIARSEDDAVEGAFVDGDAAMYLQRYHESDAGVPHITIFRVGLVKPDPAE